MFRLLTAQIFCVWLLLCASTQTLAEGGDSAKNRSDKHALIMWEVPLTYTPRLGPGLGMIAGLFWSDNGIIEGYYNKTSYSEYFGALFDTSTKLETDEVVYGARLKQFFGNSFHMDVGVEKKAYRSLYRVVGDTDNRHVDYSVTATGPTFAIGHQWQWSYFTLGCDWLRVFKPTKYERTTLSVGKDIDAAKQTETDDMIRSRTNALDMSIRMYLGLAF